MSDVDKTEIVKLTQRLLDSIAGADWETYRSLCDPSLSAFEPEARGHLVEGLAFHKFYFDLGTKGTPRSNTICSPHVRLLGPEVAVISYVRLVQHVDGSGTPQTASSEETRVWHRQEGRWQHVHFHRSANA
jgi:calcium/calmodulin-dependent protein kinase (CaM kinase) II